MKVLIAPDSFKGSLSAKEVCEIMKKAILTIDDDCEVDTIPMADGGEGTTEAIVYNIDGKYINCLAVDALNRPITAKYGLSKDNSIAIMEMAETSGIINIKTEELNPLEATTKGVGEMIIDALNHGCKKILIGIGGSATNDGGIGMLSSLGYKFYDKDQKELYPSGKNLINIRAIDDTNVDKRLKDLEIEVACDVNNVLLGNQGATYVYGTQKGATKSMLKELEKGMENYVDQIIKYNGENVNKIQGGGAAGGLGAALVGFLNADLKSGFEMVKNAIDLEATIRKQKYDYIFTGEGQINNQTLNGKLPFGIAKLGQKYEIDVIAIVGSIGEGYEQILNEGMKSIFSIVNKPMEIEEAMKSAKELLFDTTGRVFRLLIMN